MSPDYDDYPPDSRPKNPDDFYHRFNNNATNVMWWHKIGGVGFLGYDGATAWEKTKPHLERACAYFAQSKPQMVFLYGHWNIFGLGCDWGMSTPAVFGQLAGFEGCKPYVEKNLFKYFDGHTHCNKVQWSHFWSSAVDGFMIGGHGMNG